MNRPGHYVRPDEDERQGLARILTQQLSPDGFMQNDIDQDWQIRDLVATWWRPNFETFQVDFFFFINFHTCLV